MSLAAGTRLGPYEVVASVGAGGMGEVYRARDTRLERTVAIKVLPQDLSSSPALRQRFPIRNVNVGVRNAGLETRRRVPPRRAGAREEIGHRLFTGRRPT